MSKLAIIGGTSLQQLKGFEVREQVQIESVYGEVATGIEIGNFCGREVVFMNRHGKTQKLPPHAINYRANIDALSQLGVNRIIALNVVGGISEFANPLHFSVPDQIIDYTHGRDHSFFDGRRSGLAYADFAEPFDSMLRQQLISAAEQLNLDRSPAGFSRHACYGCTQGPRLESKAEIRRMQQDGCDLVGMTMMPEAALAMEKQIAYASLCLVVNKASGMGESLSLEKVYQVVEQGNKTMEEILAVVFA